MSGAIVEVNGVGYKIIELEARCLTCKQEGDNISEVLGYSSHAHIVYELLLDRVGESSLNVKE